MSDRKGKFFDNQLQQRQCVGDLELNADNFQQKINFQQQNKENLTEFPNNQLLDIEMQFKPQMDPNKQIKILISESQYQKIKDVQHQLVEMKEYVIENVTDKDTKNQLIKQIKNIQYSIEEHQLNLGVPPKAQIAKITECLRDLLKSLKNICDNTCCNPVYCKNAHYLAKIFCLCASGLALCNLFIPQNNHYIEQMKNAIANMLHNLENVNQQNNEHGL